MPICRTLPRRRLLVAALTVALPVCGCTHVLEIDNYPDAPLPAGPPGRPIAVGVANGGGGAHAGDYVEAVARSLQLQSRVSRVVYPYQPGSEVDVVATVAVNTEYRGAGTNFLVNWPGFLVFAPAWNGYQYHANPRTQVQIVDLEGETIGRFDWEYDYEFHQSDIGRTWTQLSWLEWSVIAFVGGILFTQYDTDQTPHFIDAAKDSYGTQIAVRIADALAAWNPAEP